jgi:hypothetical protein
MGLSIPRGAVRRMILSVWTTRVGTRNRASCFRDISHIFPGVSCGILQDRFEPAKDTNLMQFQRTPKGQFRCKTNTVQPFAKINSKTTKSGREKRRRVEGTGIIQLVLSSCTSALKALPLAPTDACIELVGQTSVRSEERISQMVVPI